MVEKKAEEAAPAPAFAVGKTEKGCDVFSGRWVWDEVRRPLYEEWECPYIQPQLTCQKHGRPDKDYQHWRWQPHRCSLPRLISLHICTKINKNTSILIKKTNIYTYIVILKIKNLIFPQKF